MSILKNKRRVSTIEYSHNYHHRVYKEIKSKMRNIPYKYRDDISKPIMEIANDIYKDILELNDLFHVYDEDEKNDTEFKKKKNKKRFELCKQIFTEFDDLIKNFYYYWNLSSSHETSLKPVPLHSREHLAKIINKEISLIYGLAQSLDEKKAEKIKYKTMIAFNYDKIKETKFLLNLYHLLRYIKKIRKELPKCERNCEILIVRDLALDCFTDAYTANNIYPKSQEDYLRRKRLFSSAISSLYKINKPLGEVFMYNDVSNKNQQKACNCIKRTANMLLAVQKSDKERFSAL